MNEPNGELIDVINAAMRRREAMNDRATPYEIALAVTPLIAKAWDEGAIALADSFWDGESGNPGRNPYREDA